MAAANPVLTLVEELREEAELYARDGALVRGEKLLGRLADEVEAAWQEYQLEELTLREAAEESGYSYDRLHHLVADGEIPNAGRKGAPRLRRCDLPRKPGSGNGDGAGGPGDFAEDILRARREAKE